MLTVLALLAPCIATILLARSATSMVAKMLLSGGGVFFLLVISVMIAIQQQCTGDLITGLDACAPAFLQSFGTAFSGPLVLAFVAYPIVGPAILLASALMEYLKRRAA